jgi:hypothetical protein
VGAIISRFGIGGDWSLPCNPANADSSPPGGEWDRAFSRAGRGGAFAKVGFSILPLHIRRNSQVRGRMRRMILGRPTRRTYSGLLKARHPSLCVPQDFDLSPYFDVVKFNARDPIEFDHVRAE